MALRRSARVAALASPLKAAAPLIAKKATGKGRPTTKAKGKAAVRGKATKSTASTSSARRPGVGPTRDHERRKWAKGFKLVAGVDEAGRGPLVGPVVAAACVLSRDLDLNLAGLDDSKKMTEEQREECFEVLTSNPDAISYAWHSIDAKEIDEINILQASLKAMELAVSKLPTKPDYVLIDGNRIPKNLSPDTTEAIVKGDGKSIAIAAASVIAKVVRDRMMFDLHKEYPQYGFDKHKGYGVPQHLQAIRKHGPCPHHRRTFAPIKYM